MRTTQHLLALVTLSAALLAAPTLGAEPPRGDGRETSAALKADAKRRFNMGIELFREGDFNAALVEFLRAYEEVPNYRVLYNLGQVEFQLQDYPNALNYFERFLSEGGAEVPRARRTEVEREIEKLRHRVAKLRVDTTPPGAEVAVDDVPAGRTPLAAPLIVSAGRRKVTVSLESRPPLSRLVDIAGGDEAKVEFAFPDTPPAAPTGGPPLPPSPAPSRPEAPAERAPFPWLAWGVTGALAAGAAAGGVLALGAASDFDDRKATAPTRRDDLEDAHGKLQRYTIATDVLLGLTAVSAGFATYLTLTRDKRAAPAAAATALRLGFGPAGAALSGQF